MNRIARSAIALTFALPYAAILAGEPTPTPPAMAAKQQVPSGAHLGVVVETPPPALVAQLPDSVPRGQGVLIGRVEPNSPAEAGGLKPFDLLLSYDDQKLFSPEQLSRLVAADRGGRPVTLELIRGGQIQTIQVTLGQGAPQAIAPKPWRNEHPHFPHHAFPAMPEQRWETETRRFESLKVERLEGERYRAAIEYLAADGDKRHYVFEGTRDELNTQIRQSEELPPGARRQLLNALNLKGSWPMRRFMGPFDFEEMMRMWREGGWRHY